MTLNRSSAGNGSSDSGGSALGIVMRFVVPAIFGVIVLAGLIGNLLVILVVCIHRSLRNCTNILIASLAGADLAFLTFCVPLTAAIYVRQGWAFGAVTCQLFQYFTYLTAYMSVYTLVLMSADRYLAVVHPLVSISVRTEQNALRTVIATWLIFGGANFPLLLNSGVVYGPTNPLGNPDTDREYYCTYMPLVTYNTSLDGFVENYTFAKNYFLLFFTFGFCLPLAGIVVLYSFLIMRLLCHQRSTSVGQSVRAMKSKRRVTRMVIAVVIIFAICWLPIQIVFIVQVFKLDPETLAFRIFHIVGNALAYSNSMMNPILYAFFSNNFRSAFKSLLLCENTNMSAREFEKTCIYGKKATDKNLLRLIPTDGGDDLTNNDLNCNAILAVDKHPTQDDAI